MRVLSWRTIASPASTLETRAAWPHRQFAPRCGQAASARLQFSVMSEETPIPQSPAISEELRAYMREIGRLGGLNRSERKVRAARRNVRKAARVMVALSMKSLKRWQQRSAV
jgi:hypothetical protein